MGDTSGGQYIYWLGGFSSSGKTTAADALSEMLGYAVLHRDVVIPDHERRLQASNNPIVQDYLKLRREGRYHDFFARSPEQVAAESLILIAEDFVLTLADLEAEPPQGPTILEGARLRADLIFQNFAAEGRVAWLRPSEAIFGNAISTRPILLQRAEELGPHGLRQLTRIFYLGSELQIEIARDYGVEVVTIEDPTDYPKIPAEVARIWDVAI
jgi:hypothetical protein